jgi:hypothetical protein
MPGAQQALGDCAEFADYVILTGRGAAARRETRRWIGRNLGSGLRLEMRPSRSETSAAFKLRRATELGSLAHVEDDPNTALLLAPSIRVYLVDWKRNAGVEHANVVRVRDVREAVSMMRRELSMHTRGEPGPRQAGERS